MYTVNKKWGEMKGRPDRWTNCKDKGSKKAKVDSVYKNYLFWLMKEIFPLWRLQFSSIFSGWSWWSPPSQRTISRSRLSHTRRYHRIMSHDGTSSTWTNELYRCCSSMEATCVAPWLSPLQGRRQRTPSPVELFRRSDFHRAISREWTDHDSVIVVATLAFLQLG